MIVPKSFANDLKLVDPTYRVQDPEDHVGYFIVKDIDLTLKADGGKTLFIRDEKELRVRGPCIVLWVPELGSGAIERLREMKMQALELKIYDDPLNELAYYRALNLKAKKKKMELAVDMISEGLMEKHRLERKKSWSYGGSKKNPQEA